MCLGRKAQYSNAVALQLSTQMSGKEVKVASVILTLLSSECASSDCQPNPHLVEVCVTPLKFKKV